MHLAMIYTAQCIMFRMRAYSLRGQVGGGWALEFSSFLGPMKWHRWFYAQEPAREVSWPMHTEGGGGAGA
jgi:hypothetical protein